jgi:hypothetical protein
MNKLVAICGNCHCRLGVTFERGAVIPKLFCVACEPFAAHQEEERLKNEAAYKAACAAMWQGK